MVTCWLPATAVTPVGAVRLQAFTGVAETGVEGAERQVPLLALTT
jgi:hypothetical protein